MAKIILKDVRIAFPKLFEPKAVQGSETKRYGVVALVKPGTENDKLIRNTISKIATEAWGAKAAAYLKALAPQPNKFAYQDGTLKADKYDGYEGMWALSANRNEDQGAPVVKDRAARDLTAKDAGMLYAGCRCNVVVDLWVQKGQYEGIRATLLGVQFVSDDEPFAGARASEDDFEVLEPVTDVDVDALFGGADPKAPENVAVETDDIAF